MKPFIALVVLLFSFSVHAAPRVSPDVSRACAELMGDVVYFQVDNSSRARERLMLLLGKVESQSAKGQAKGDVQGLALAGNVRQLLSLQVNRAPYDAGKYKDVVDSYETLVQVYGPAAAADQGFLVLDLRYRYLSKTLAAVNDGTITSAPMIRSLEEAFADADKAMRQGGAKNPEAQRKWGFLRSRVLDYNNAAIPALANSMTLKIAGDFGGADGAMMASASR